MQSPPSRQNSGAVRSPPRRQNSRASREATLPSVDGDGAPLEMPSTAKPLLWVGQPPESEPQVMAVASSSGIWQQPLAMESYEQTGGSVGDMCSNFRLLLQQVEMEHEREIGLMRAELQSQLHNLLPRADKEASGDQGDEHAEEGNRDNEVVEPSSTLHDCAPALCAQDLADKTHQHGGEDGKQAPLFTITSESALPKFAPQESPQAVPVNGCISDATAALESQTEHRKASLQHTTSSRTQAFAMQQISNKLQAVQKVTKVGRLSELMSDLATKSREHPEEAVRHRYLMIISAIVHSPLFDGVCASAIILNAILLGVATDVVARKTNPNGLPRIFTYADRSFSAWFLFELCLRLVAAGPFKFFFGADWSWNLFDTLVVLTDLVETSVAFFSGQVSTLQNLTAIRMLRVLRLARAIRVIRLVRFFKELRMMVYSVLRSGLSLLWSMILLTLVIFVFSVYLTQNVTFYLYMDAEPGTDITERLSDYFGSLIFAMYMLFKCISGGISWGEVGEPLLEVHWSNGIVLCFFVFFTVFAVLNIITGIFVDAALNSAQTDRDEVIQEAIHSENSALFQMQKFFLEADADRSGTITVTELEDQLQNPRVRAHLRTLGVEVHDAKSIFRLLDLDRSGEISIEEFIFGCMRMKGNAKSVDLLTLIHENRRLKDHVASFFVFVRDKFQEQRGFQDKMDSLLTQQFSPRSMKSELTSMRKKDPMHSKEFNSGSNSNFSNNDSKGSKTPPTTGAGSL